jgi:hypothetical protein
MPDEPITLRDLLLRDWHTELPIRGGHGQSREDPIIVTTPDPEEVALTQVLTLRGLGRGRGIFWRTITRALLGVEWPGIEQFKIETVELTDAQIATRIENYYFDVSAMIASHGRWQQVPVIVHCDVSGLAFPYEIGWMHFDNSANNELQAPGLGQSLHYKAPGMICSLYVYDRSRTDIPDDVTDRVIEEEFESAAREIAATKPTLVAWPDHQMRQHCLERYYRVGDTGREASLLCLTGSRGRFIKARVTWPRDRFVDHAAMTFVDALLEISRAPRPTVGGAAT